MGVRWKVALVYDGPVPDEAAKTSPDGRCQSAHFGDFDEAMHWLTA